MKIITLIIIAFTIFTFNLYSEKNNFSTSSKIINEFNFLIYKNLAKQDVNLFFSPYSISTAIAMTYAGSKGKTEKEIAETMFYNQAGKDIHNLFSQLHKHINGLASDNVKLDSANSLWGSKKYKFNKTYIDFVNKYYAGAFNILDFSKFKKARKTINTWVEEKTHNLIRELIPDGIINTATKLVLVNAIYFKGIWEYKFKKKNTLEKPFHLLNGKDKMVLMMEIQKSYNYCESKEVKVLEIAYKENKVSMIIFLPKIFDGLKKLETKVNLDFYNNHVNKMMISNVKLTLPKYKLESTFKLSKTLKRLGMKRSFSDSADFSLMSPENIGLKIDEVIHKAFVDVNESGTEAAAATAVISRKRGSARRGSKFDHVKFKVDHPFMFFIRDNKSKAILFCGRVLDPCPGIGKIIQRSKDVNNDNEVDSSSTNQYNKFFRLPDPSYGVKLLGTLIHSKGKLALLDYSGMIIIVTEKQTVPGAFKVISITSNKIIFYNLRKRRQKVIQIESFAEVKDLKDDEFYLTYGKVNIITLFQLMTKVCDGKIVFDDKSGFKIGPKTLRGLLKDIVNVFCKKNEMGLLFSKSKKEYTVFK